MECHHDGMPYNNRQQEGGGGAAPRQEGRLMGYIEKVYGIAERFDVYEVVTYRDFERVGKKLYRSGYHADMYARKLALQGEVVALFGLRMVDGDFVSREIACC